MRQGEERQKGKEGDCYEIEFAVSWVEMSELQYQKNKKKQKQNTAY